MIPTWAAVISALSLAIIAVAVLIVAGAAVVAALGMRATLAYFRQLAGPAVDDVRGMIGAIRSETDALVGTSRDIRLRIVRAADAADARLGDLQALMDVLQEEVDDAALDAAATVRTVRKGVAAVSWGRRLITRTRKRKPR